MKIALTLNTRKSDDESQREFDPPHTIELIKQAIENAGHEYLFIEANENVQKNLENFNPDLVFNRAEGLRGESRESFVPAILEMLEIPYVGSGPATLAVCLNKAWAKMIVSASGVNTSLSHVFLRLQDAENCDMKFPVILKPNCEGSSIGINADNVVYDKAALLSKLDEMIRTYNQGILVEPFISGREFSVGVIARPNDIEVLSILEIDFSKMPASVGNVFGLTAKSDYDDLANYLCPAPVDKELELALKRNTINACKALNIRDFARLDFRVDNSNKVWFLEINPLPGMDYDEATKDFSFYPLIAMKSGYDYNSLINELIKSCLAHNSSKNK